MRNQQIQVLRGIAIIAVVAIHTISWGGYSAVLIRPLFNFAVAMFLFLSGYLTDRNGYDVKAFYWKRIRRVLIPYLLWSIVYTAVYGRWDSFFRDLLTAKCCTIYYYIFVYIQFVLLHPIIVKLYQSRFMWTGWLVTPISLIALRYMPRVFHFSVDQIFHPACFFGLWFAYYYFGFYAADLKGGYTFPLTKKKIFALWVVTYIVSVLEGTIWYSLCDMDMATSQLRLSSMLCSLCCLYVAALFIYAKTEIKSCLQIFILIGDCSFGIYLAHPLIRDVLYVIPIWKNMVFPVSTILLILASTICVLVGKKLLGKYTWILGM